MKYRAIQVLRRTGLLKWADAVKLLVHRMRVNSANRAFVARHPHFAVPPPDLAFDAYNHANWVDYMEGGRKHAGMFARIIDDNLPQNELEILEWGCGPARIIRHLPSKLRDHRLRLHGCDYNPRTVAWCVDNIKGIRFVLNQLLPPLPYASASFDAVYCFSVFTHLSEDAQHAWSAELRRVLKPGGLLLCTTHGDRYRYLLVDPHEQVKYENGDVVVQGQYAEGKKWYFAVHPPVYVRDVLLRGFERVDPAQILPEDDVMQDVWVARTPAAGGGAL